MRWARNTVDMVYIHLLNKPVIYYFVVERDTEYFVDFES